MEAHSVQQSETGTLKFCLLHCDCECADTGSCGVFFVLYFIYLLNLALPVCCSLCGLLAHGWATVSASLPCGKFCPYLGWDVTPSHLLVALALCVLKDNLGFC